MSSLVVCVGSTRVVGKQTTTRNVKDESKKEKGRNKATFRLFNEKVMNYLSPKNELISSPQFGQTGDNDEGVLTVGSDQLRI